jgi:hypothetical protein
MEQKSPGYQANQPPQTDEVRPQGRPSRAAVQQALIQLPKSPGTSMVPGLFFIQASPANGFLFSVRIPVWQQDA